MKSLNRVQLIGNLGQNPEIRRLQSGNAVANLRIATSESWKDKQSGERREHTEWHNVVVFSKPLVEVCEKYLKKGSKVWLEGRLQTREWEDQQAQKRFSTEIVIQGIGGNLMMLDPPPSRGPSEPAGRWKSSDEVADMKPIQEPAESRNPAPSFHDDLDDGIPF